MISFIVAAISTVFEDTHARSRPSWKISGLTAIRQDHLKAVFTYETSLYKMVVTEYNLEINWNVNHLNPSFKG